MNPNQRRCRQIGFTLIELMVVIILTGVIMGIALPKMGNMIAQQRVQNNIEQIWSLLQFSKAEALRGNRPVIVCPTTVSRNSAQSNGCNAIGNAVGNANPQGFLAFSDNNMSQKYETNNDTLLRSVFLGQNNQPAKVSTIVEACINQNNQNQCDILPQGQQLIFLPDGRFGWGSQNNWTLGSRNISITIHDIAKPAQIWQRLIVTPSGKATVCSFARNAQQSNLCRIEQ